MKPGHLLSEAEFKLFSFACCNSSLEVVPG